MVYTLIWCIDKYTHEMKTKQFGSFEDLQHFVYKDIEEDLIYLKCVDKEKTLYYLTDCVATKK